MKILDRLLYDIIERYGNECCTRFLPKHLDYLVITLACPTPFELIIKKNEPGKKVEFFEKQGILGEVALGSIVPGDEQAGVKAAEIVERFINNYEVFKNMNWQIM